MQSDRRESDISIIDQGLLNEQNLIEKIKEHTGIPALVPAHRVLVVALLKMANLPEYEEWSGKFDLYSSCSPHVNVSNTGDYRNNPDLLFVRLTDEKEKQSEIEKLVENLQEKYGSKICHFAKELTYKHDLDEDDNTYEKKVIFSIAELINLLPTILENIDEFFNTPKNLKAYRAATHGWKNSNLNPELGFLTRIPEEYGLSTVPPYVEGLLPVGHQLLSARSRIEGTIIANMFGCKGYQAPSKFTTGFSFVGSWIETNIGLDISAVTAQAIVEEINKQFPCSDNPAKLVDYISTVTSDGFLETSWIAIDNSVMCSPAFQEAYRASLLSLGKDQLALINKYWKQADPTHFSDCNNASLVVKGVAEKCKDKDEHKTNLAEKLITFSSLFTNPLSNRNDKLNAYQQVRRALKRVEGHLDEVDKSEEGEFYADKSVIKSELRRVGYGRK